MQQESEILTNPDVVKMVQAHLGADVIVNQIQSHPGNYSLSTNSLIKLKQAGVPDKVIAAMQAKAAASVPAGASHGPNNHSPGSRPNTSNVTSPAGVTQASRPVAPLVRQLTGQPGGAETFTLQTCPLLETDKILFLNFLRMEPRALDDEAILSRFVILNNQCERQYSEAQLGNELEYPQIAQAYKAKASEILSGVPSEITFPANVIPFGPYDTAHGLFPLDTRNSMVLKDLGRGSYTSGEGTKITPSSALFPSDTVPVALIKLRYEPFVLHGLPIPESDAKQFLAELLQASEAGKAQIHADPFSVANAADAGSFIPDATRAVYVVVKIKLLPTPPQIVMQGEWSSGGVREKGTIELAGQIIDVSFLKQHPAEWNKNIPPVAVLHPDPAAGDAERQAEALFIKKQYGDALPLAERSCKAGNPRGCGLEGSLYALGLGVTADLQHGINQIYDSCEVVGDAVACYLSALVYQKIGGVKLTDAHGMGHPGLESTFGKSCELGFSDGCFREAAFEYNEAAQNCRGLGACPGQQRALVRFENACEIGIQLSTAECNGGDPFGCDNLALCYSNGAGVNKDPEKAKQIFAQGCALGDKEQCKEAQSQAPEETAKINAMQEKCSSGDREGCFQLGLIYRKGKEVPQDLEMARKYFQASCNLGSRVGCAQAQLLH
jgi:uncharacterized protein